MTQPFTSIEAYITTFPPTTQLVLQQMRNLVSTTVPAAHETISYQMPTFRLHGNLIHFAGYKKHIGFYPGAKTMAAFLPQLHKYKHAKGSVQFPLSEPLPIDLITKMLLFKVAEDTLQYHLKRSNKVSA